MKTVVIYKSKTGFTKSYAEWIAEALQCDLKENHSLKSEDLVGYDTIIYGGGMYASGVDGLDLIKKNYDDLKGKNLVIWATGCNPGRKEEMDAVWTKHFSEEQLKNIHTYYLRGGFNYSKLSKGNKVLMSMLKWKLKKTEDKTEDMVGMLHAYEEPEDHRDKKNIEPLVTYVRSLSVHK